MAMAPHGPRAVPATGCRPRGGSASRLDGGRTCAAPRRARGCAGPAGLDRCAATAEGGWGWGGHGLGRGPRRSGAQLPLSKYPTRRAARSASWWLLGTGLFTPETFYFVWLGITPPALVVRVLLPLLAWGRGEGEGLRSGHNPTQPTFCDGFAGAAGVGPVAAHGRLDASTRVVNRPDRLRGAVRETSLPPSPAPRCPPRCSARAISCGLARMCASVGSVSRLRLTVSSYAVSMLDCHGIQTRRPAHRVVLPTASPPPSLQGRPGPSAAGPKIGLRCRSQGSCRTSRTSSPRGCS